MARYALVFDLRRCIGCLTCVMACKVQNSLVEGYSWMRVVTHSQGKYPRLAMYWQPMTCMQCQEPPCRDACPRQAIYRRPDGIVMIRASECDGCSICLSACPYDAIRLNPRKQVAEKCTLCAPRVEQGLSPFCVKECVWKAIHFGDLDDARSDVSKLLASRPGYVIHPEKGTGPSVHYLAP